MQFLVVLAYWFGPSLFLLGFALGVRIEERWHAERFTCRRKRQALYVVGSVVPRP